MRMLLIPTLACLAWPVLADEPLARCAAMESAVERLDCYDALARERAEMAASTPAAPAPAAPNEAPSQVPAPPAQRADPADAMGAVRSPREEPEAMSARIESVSKAALGQHVLTLSNGQVWMENEPGRRPIEANQDIVIRKHRWHYELELPGRPDVAVRRIK